MAIKTFESFVNEKDSAQVNENPMVAMAAMSAADKMKEAYDAMKENAMEIDGDESELTAASEACEMMKENAALAAMAAKDLAEMMKEVHVPGHEDESNVAEGKVNEIETNVAKSSGATGAVADAVPVDGIERGTGQDENAAAAAMLMKDMKEAFDTAFEGAKEEIAAELIKKEMDK